MLKLNKTKNKIPFIILIILIIFINPISARGCSEEGFMGTYQQNTSVTITETCPTCSFINITIKDIYSNSIIINQQMTLSNGLFSYTISKGNHTEIGTYFVEGYSNLDNPFKACYVITNIQRETSTSESLLYIFLLLISLLLFIFCLWGSFILPFSNKKNALGRVLDITWIKYFKITLIVLTYLSFLWMINLGVSITNNLISLTQFSGFFTMIFNLLTAIAFPFFIVIFIFVNVSLIKDLKLNKLLSRGINPR